MGGEFCGNYLAGTGEERTKAEVEVNEKAA